MKTYILMLLPALLLASCSLFGDDNGNKEVSEVEEQRLRWERLGIDTYEFDLTRSCFCERLGSVRVQVRADTVHSATALETGEPVTDFFLTQTVDGLFDVIEDAFARDAHRLDVEYDDTFHYPTLVDIDYQEFTIDEEVMYSAENFNPLRTP